MKKSELLEVLENELNKEMDKINIFSNDANPQIKELYHMAIGKKDILEAITYYVKTGSKLYF